MTRRHDHDDHPSPGPAPRVDLGTDGLALFDVPAGAIMGMVRANGSAESQSSAVRVLPGRGALQDRIVTILREEGPMTDRELEERAEFASQYGPSTVRKRRSELLQAGRVSQVGRRDGMAVWGGDMSGYVDGAEMIAAAIQEVVDERSEGHYVARTLKTAGGVVILVADYHVVLAWSKLMRTAVDAGAFDGFPDMHVETVEWLDALDTDLTDFPQ